MDVFIAEKRVEGLTSDLIKKYTLWLGRLVSFCEGHGVYTLRAIDRELLIAFCANWETLYPSSMTRSKLLERYKSFFRVRAVRARLVELVGRDEEVLAQDGKAARRPRRPGGRGPGQPASGCRVCCRSVS